MFHLKVQTFHLSTHMFHLQVQTFHSSTHMSHVQVQTFYLSTHMSHLQVQTFHLSRETIFIYHGKNLQHQGKKVAQQPFWYPPNRHMFRKYLPDPLDLLGENLSKTPKLRIL